MTNSQRWWRTGEACRAAVHRGYDLMTEQQQDSFAFFLCGIQGLWLAAEAALGSTWCVSSDAAIIIVPYLKKHGKENKQIIFIPHVLSISLVRPDNHQRSITKIKCKPFQRDASGFLFTISALENTREDSLGILLHMIWVYSFSLQFNNVWRWIYFDVITSNKAKCILHQSV